jgi:GT2 family glycosyltransferase
VVVSDNGSTDNSLDHIKAWAENQVSHAPSSQGQYAQLFAESLKKTISFVEYGAAVAEQGGAPEARDVPLVLIRNDSNLGFAGGNNVGLRYALARGDFAYVWLLNNDTVVTPCSLSHLVTRLQQRTDAGMCGSTLLNYRNPHKVQALGGGYYCRWIGLPWHLGRLRRSGGQINRAKVEKWTNFVVGASMLVSREFLLDVGLMCEDYFLYFEEADWAMRARNRYKLVYAPESVVYHVSSLPAAISRMPCRQSI